MRAHSTQCGVAERLQIEYTAKPVSGWGGLVAWVRYFDKVGLRAWLQQALPDGRTSPNQIPAGEIILAFFAAVLTGATRFAHGERLRADAVVRAILGVARMPSAMTLTRYLGGFVRSQVEHLTEVLWRFTLARLHSSPLGAVLDLDGRRSHLGGVPLLCRRVSTGQANEGGDHADWVCDDKQRRHNLGVSVPALHGPPPAVPR